MNKLEYSVTMESLQINKNYRQLCKYICSLDGVYLKISAIELY